MMKTIVVVSEGPEERVTTWAVNRRGDGLFYLDESGGWHQVEGTCDFHARSPAELSRKIRAGGNPYDRRMVRGSARGW